MKCVKCGKEYDAGAHYCKYCGEVTAEGELSLALADFAKAAKHLAKQTTKIGGRQLKGAKPDLNRAAEKIVDAASEIKEAARPAGKAGLEAARATLQLVAQVAENVASELRKASDKR